MHAAARASCSSSSSRTGFSAHSAPCRPRCTLPRASQRVPLARPSAATSPELDGAPVTLEPSRHMALPNSGMWLLDFLQDKFYDVRGPSFVIQRAESGEDGGGARRRRRSKARKLVRQQEAGGAAGSGGSSRALRLINRVVQHHPGSIMLLEGGVVDVSEWMEPCGDDAPQPQPPPANTTCTGIVRVEQPEEEAPEEDVYFNSSTSPRRTKAVGFTCKCCGARTYSRVNPRSFLEGTLVAQCAKCERWHKLSDHFGLFHDLQGPVLGGRPLVQVEDVPPSLRLRDEEEGGAQWW